ncbi:hypothetical protein [uncultured Flavobacterium sp.]|uniref:hypothetical protein n=1 Tax=uncultured Flavobacterium sp. TaxID=165435 RepID=UPI0030CA4613|tara:strand:+ start:9848 stop:10060 length:213 start_codon:yes stop_codon:yes gene_type:complete
MKNISKTSFIYGVLMIIAATTGKIVVNYISRDLELGYMLGATLLVITFIYYISIKLQKTNIGRLLSLFIP